MTLTPTDYRTWRAEAATRDRQYADAYRAGWQDADRRRQEHRRLATVAAAAGAFVLLRRVHVLVALAVVAILSPVLLVVLVVELTVHQHRRHQSWPRTGAYVLAWLVGIGLVLLAVLDVSPWPLAGVAGLVVTWTVACHIPYRVAYRRAARRKRAVVSAPFTDADRTLAPRIGEHTPEPFRVVYTSKARHREVRQHADGRTVTVDTLTGETVETRDKPYTAR